MVGADRVRPLRDRESEGEAMSDLPVQVQVLIWLVAGGVLLLLMDLSYRPLGRFVGRVLGAPCILIAFLAGMSAPLLIVLVAGYAVVLSTKHLLGFGGPSPSQMDALAQCLMMGANAVVIAAIAITLAAFLWERTDPWTFTNSAF